VVISPASSTTPVNERRQFRGLPRDRSRRRVEEDLQFAWEIAEGGGSLANTTDQEVGYPGARHSGPLAPKSIVTQRDVTCTAEALVTITDSLETSISTAIVNARGLPGYTFERAAGELWRSRFDPERNLIIVNSGHRDFVFATKNRALQLRYLVRLYVKELVLKNFTAFPPEQLLERMIELALYAEEKLKAGGSWTRRETHTGAAPAGHPRRGQGAERILVLPGGRALQLAAALCLGGAAMSRFRCCPDGACGRALGCRAACPRPGRASRPSSAPRSYIRSSMVRPRAHPTTPGSSRVTASRPWGLRPRRRCRAAPGDRRPRQVGHSRPDRFPRALLPVGQSLHAAGRRRLRRVAAVCNPRCSATRPGCRRLFGSGWRAASPASPTSADPFWNFHVRDAARNSAAAPRVAVTGPLISMVEDPKLDLGDPPIVRISSAEQARQLVATRTGTQARLHQGLVHSPDPDDDLAAHEAIVRATAEAAHAAGLRTGGTRH